MTRVLCETVAQAVAALREGKTATFHAGYTTRAEMLRTLAEIRLQYPAATGGKDENANRWLVRPSAS